jgi:uncharacterized membrane protein
LLAALITIAAVAWCVTLIAAPYALNSANPRLISAATTVYRASGLICHQRASRSFHLAGVQLPVCGRCAGLYFSGALGAMLGWVASTRTRTVRWTRLVLLWAALPTALSILVELSGLVDPSNPGRALCALPLGAAAGWIFVNSLRSEAAGSVVNRESLIANP